MIDDERQEHVPDIESTEAEGFLTRWSRLKARSRQDDEVAKAPASAPREQPDAGDDPAGSGETAADELPLPPLESLTEDSDYSAFLSPRVSADLRRTALRKLFRSQKFNVCDGLDVYCRDYTKFEPLGDIVTADMRHQLERAAKLAASLGAEAEPRGERDAAPLGATAARAEHTPETDRRDADNTTTDPDDDLVEPA